MTKYAARAPELGYFCDTYLDRDWMRLAACRGENPEMWFPNQHRPSKHSRAMQLTAQAICHTRCPVRRACLNYAITIDARYGIYGGATEDDRAALTGKRSYG